MSQLRPADVDRPAPDGQAARSRTAGAAARAGALGQRWSAAMRERWPAVLREHWLAAALLTVGLALRILAQFAYRPALFYIDSVKYLYSSDGNDPEGYKAPLRAILAVSNFNTVVAVQHLLGLAMAVVLYVLLLRRGAGRWLAALAIAPLLLDGYQLQSEQTIMPGTWFEALIVAGLAILLWQPKTSWRATVVAGIVLGTSATVAQVGEALILPAAIYLLAAGGGWRQAVGKAAALCAACALPILAYCAGSYLLTGNFFLSHAGVTSVYGRMAAAVDCATIKLPAAERAMCPTKAQQAKGSNWLEFGNYSPIRPYYNDIPRAKADNLISNFDHQVLVQQPLRVLAAYERDVMKLYAVDRVTMPGDAPISRWQFQTKFPYFTSHATPQVVRAAITEFGGGMPAVWRPVADFLHAYQLDGGYTPGPLLLLLTVTGLIGSGVALFRRRAAAAVRQPALACLLFFICGAALLLMSDLFVFSWRYQLPALVTLVPAGALGIGVIVRSVRTPGENRASGP
jgi:hypothetical protein